MPWTGRRPSKSNPRRPPAHLSVSLRRTSAETAMYRSEARRVKSKDGFSYIEGSPRLPIFDETSDGSPSSLQRVNGTDGSGESSNADEWLFQSNNEVHEKVKSFADTDFPFFIRKSSSSDSLLEDQERQCSRQSSTGGPTRQSRLMKGLFQLENDRNTTKDFRSIIDDLTIENKKLKRRLKRYIKLHDTHNSSNDQKLFEVRVHNLGLEEKRKLEEVLLGFVHNLPYREKELEPWGNDCECTRPNLNYHNGESSQASPRIGDSAYASMSASGLDPTTPPCHGSGHDQITQPAKRQKNHSQHNTEGLLLPLAPTTMAERAKKRLVVKRLEQIFAGEDSLISAHHQALQKKDMLQTAERTNGSEVRGKRTGTEVTHGAPIMRNDTEDTSNAGIQEQPKVSADSKRQAADIADKHNLASNLPNSSFKEQRPTGPLDLDPIRAQCPVENLSYLKHLGFSSLGPTDSLEEGGGWLRLNLLMNMAKLHSLNVTCDFVREAFSEYGVRFEMSNDGQKVRWKGDSRLRSTNMHTADSSRRRNDDTVDAQSPRERVKTTRHHGHRSSSLSDLHRNDATPYRDAEQHNYKLCIPFCHHLSTQDSYDCMPEGKEEDDIPYMQQSSDRLTIVSGPGVCESSTLEKRKLDNGLIIFYQNAHFFTDLTGEPAKQRHCEPPLYKLFVPEPLGKPRLYDDIHCKIYEKRGLLEGAKELPEPMDLADNPIPESMELAFPRPSFPKFSDEVHGPHNINLDVTGVGGIYPADNFAVIVQVRHARAEWIATSPVPIRNSPGITHNRLVKIIRVINPQRRVHAPVGYHVANLQWVDYLPSALPPPLCLMSPGGESTSEEASSVG